MGDMMEFPPTVEEFMERYKMVDSDHIYSNGTEYVPIFRMKQWFNHARSVLQERKCESCVHYLPSTFGGKPFCFCDDSNCYEKREEEPKMRGNVIRFMDYRAKEALARLTEQAWQERRAETLAEQRRIERERRREVHWVTNCIMIAAICAVCFIAGMCVGLA